MKRGGASVEALVVVTIRVLGDIMHGQVYRYRAGTGRLDISGLSRFKIRK